MTAVRVVFLDNDSSVKEFSWQSHVGFPLVICDEQPADMYREKYPRYEVFALKEGTDLHKEMISKQQIIFFEKVQESYRKRSVYWETNTRSESEERVLVEENVLNLTGIGPLQRVGS